MTTFPQDSSVLPLPRLIVRLGGLGNRYLGEDNGLAEASAPLWDKARRACDQVLGEVEQALLAIHEERPSERHLHHWPDSPSWWKTHALGWLFGGADRWGWARRCGTAARAFSTNPPLISMLSGDAEGADTLIRRTGATRGGSANHPVHYEFLRVTPEDPSRVPDGLGVGMPATKNQTLQAKADAREKLTRAEAHEFSDIVRRRAYAYRAQSEALRHHSDLLLAIYDPDAEGRAGGTSESVEAALREQIPVIVILITGKAEAEIHLLENLRHLRHLQGHGGMPPSPDWRITLREVLTFLLAFPDPKGTPEGGGHGSEPLTAYHPRQAFAAFRADESLRRIWPDRLWRWFDAKGRVKAVQSLLEAETDPTERAALEAELAKALKNQTSAVRNFFLPPEPVLMPAETGREARPPDHDQHYERARRRASSTGMSGVFGDAYRGGIILSYVLAALAVVLAVVGGLLHVWHAPAWLQAGLAMAELGAIFFMWSLQVSSTTDEWNAAYTDTRILAEALRLMKCLAPLGVHTPLPRLPYYLRQSENAANPDRLWSIWYFRALVRMAPLRLGLPDLDAARQLILAEVHADQRRYHRINACKQKLLHHSLERLVPRLFGIVSFCAGVHFFDVAFSWHLPGVFHLSLIFCVGGPALIAAMHGFLSQMECLRLLTRSSSMERLLQERSDSLSALDLSAPASAEAVWGLATEALTTASLLMDETAGWSLLYRNADIHAG